ncbi:MAG: thymidine kinase [Holosporaceae bacterium]|jgi:thymidine kinase|nr:thymidine kinase [Holosporaceae bacterium]
MACLYFYYSAMSAGKTTSLLQTDHNYRERGMSTLLFTPALDTRYGPGVITSRLGIKKQAATFDKDFDFFCYVKGARSAACVLVDEAQFLTKKQVDQLGEVVDLLSIPVLTYGLRTDFQGNDFDGSQRLLAIADILVELKTVCHCGKKATMNMRVDENGRKISIGEQIEIGGNERYVSVCRKHFRSGVSKKLIENASS